MERFESRRLVEGKLALALVLVCGRAGQLPGRVGVVMPKRQHPAAAEQISALTNTLVGRSGGKERKFRRFHKQAG